MSFKTIVQSTDGIEYRGYIDETEVDAAASAVAKAVAGQKLTDAERFAATVFVAVTDQLLKMKPPGAYGIVRGAFADTVLHHLRIEHKKRVEASAQKPSKAAA